jgi:YgiT-type zinc finger domain-containing protein
LERVRASAALALKPAWLPDLKNFVSQPRRFAGDSRDLTMNNGAMADVNLTRGNEIVVNSKNEPCPLCAGNKMSGETTFTADLGSGVVVVRRVQATVCSQCGEEWIDDPTARRLEQIVDEARLKHSQVEVTAFS